MPVSQASAITCHSARRRALRERLPAVGKSFSSEDVATGRATLTRVALVGGGDQDERDEASVWGGGGGPNRVEGVWGVDIIKTHCI